MPCTCLTGHSRIRNPEGRKTLQTEEPPAPWTPPLVLTHSYGTSVHPQHSELCGLHCAKRGNCWPRLPDSCPLDFGARAHKPRSPLHWDSWGAGLNPFWPLWPTKISKKVLNIQGTTAPPPLGAKYPHQGENCQALALGGVLAQRTCSAHVTGRNWGFCYNWQHSCPYPLLSSAHQP